MNFLSSFLPAIFIIHSNIHLSMQIINQDFRKGIVKLKVNDPEDLWYLSHLIETGDLVKGLTYRKIKVGDGENAKSVKKPMTVKIEAETIDFENTNSLRINGKVKEGPEDLPKDCYQAISLEIDSEFSLEKKDWLEYQKQKLKESSEKKYQHLICLFDREEAIFALTKSFGYEIILTLKGEAPKKAEKVEIKKEFYLEIIQMLEDYSQRYKPENIILASPAFYKEDLLKKISNSELKKKMVLANCSDVSTASISEILKQPELSDILKSSRLRKEKLILDELLNEINKKGKAVYGWKEVKSAVEQGAVLKLLLTDNFIQQRKLKKEFDELDQIMKQVDSQKGEIHILTLEQESGQRLKGLGGIAAILRYKLEW